MLACTRGIHCTISLSTLHASQLSLQVQEGVKGPGDEATCSYTSCEPFQQHVRTNHCFSWQLPGSSVRFMDCKSEGRPGKAAVRKFTSEELSCLNQRHNAHVAYRGKVYDVSSFVSRHPGGVDQISIGAGRDITQLFDVNHKPETMEKVLNKFYVGELMDNESPVFPKPGSFSQTVKNRVSEYIKTHNLDPKVDYVGYIEYTTVFVLSIIGWYLALHYADNFVLHLGATLLWSITAGIIFFSSWHAAIHYAITHKPWVWKTIAAITECINGQSSVCWSYQHNIAHHTYTNIWNKDPDTYAPEYQRLWRVHKFQKWIRLNVYQHLYTSLIYILVSPLKFRLLDFSSLWVMNRTCVRINPLSLSQWVIFWTGKGVHSVMRFLVPIYFMSFGKMVLMNVIWETVNSMYIAHITQVTHINTEVEWPLPDKDNVVHQDWAEMQVRTTLDYATDSWIWYILSGALNHQTAHHLYPGMFQRHYRWITPIIRKTCGEFGIKYNCVDSYMEALSMHFRYLKNMGRKEE